VFAPPLGPPPPLRAATSSWQRPAGNSAAGNSAAGDENSRQRPVPAINVSKPLTIVYIFEIFDNIIT
jgi:hypothetical protein